MNAVSSIWPNGIHAEKGSTVSIQELKGGRVVMYEQADRVQSSRVQASVALTAPQRITAHRRGVPTSRVGRRCLTIVAGEKQSSPSVTKKKTTGPPILPPITPSVRFCFPRKAGLLPCSSKNVTRTHGVTDTSSSRSQENTVEPM